MLGPAQLAELSKNPAAVRTFYRSGYRHGCVMFVLFEMVEFHEQIWLSFLEMKLAASQKMLSAMVLLKGTHGRAVVAVASSGHRAAHAEPLVDARTYVAPAGSHVVLNGAQPSRNCCMKSYAQVRT